MIASDVLKQLKPGTTVSVQDAYGTFQGIVLARKHGSEPGATITLRGTVAGVGVEKIYPIHSPAIRKVKIISAPKKVHRAKFYWLRYVSKKTISQKLRV